MCLRVCAQRPPDVLNRNGCASNKLSITCCPYEHDLAARAWSALSAVWLISLPACYFFQIGWASFCWTLDSRSRQNKLLLSGGDPPSSRRPPDVLGLSLHSSSPDWPTHPRTCSHFPPATTCTSFPNQPSLRTPVHFLCSLTPRYVLVLCASSRLPWFCLPYLHVSPLSPVYRTSDLLARSLVLGCFLVLTCFTFP